MKYEHRISLISPYSVIFCFVFSKFVCDVMILKISFTLYYAYTCKYSHVVYHKMISSFFLVHSLYTVGNKRTTTTSSACVVSIIHITVYHINSVSYEKSSPNPIILFLLCTVHPKYSKMLRTFHLQQQLGILICVSSPYVVYRLQVLKFITGCWKNWLIKET